MASSETKDTIRENMLERRKSLGEAKQESLSRRICERIIEAVDLSEYEHILFYYPSPEDHEVDLRYLFTMAFDQLTDTRSLLPRVNSSAGIIEPHVIPDDHIETGDELKTFYTLAHRESPLSKGGFGIPEPEPDRCPLIQPDQLDLVFVPGLAFDNDGYRVGYGGGYYDKLLADLEPSALTVGVCYQFQLIDRCPREDHDRAVDRVITEQGT